jgi:hypothetical protein
VCSPVDAGDRECLLPLHKVSLTGTADVCVRVCAAQLNNYERYFTGDPFCIMLPIAFTFFVTSLAYVIAEVRTAACRVCVRVHRRTAQVTCAWLFCTCYSHVAPRCRRRA